MTADELAVAARRIDVLRAQGYQLDLASDGLLYPEGPAPLDDEDVELVEDFLRELAGLAEDSDE